MEISNNQLNGQIVNTKSENSFEFIRQKRFNSNDNYIMNNMNNMNNQSKPYSIIEKTNNLFGNKVEDKVYNSLLEQKENINLFNNQNNFIRNDNNNMKPSINLVNNEVDNFEKNINKTNNNKYAYESNFEMNRIINNNNDLSNNKKLYKNKEYYFNYRNDESFNRLNEQNIFPINIKYNLMYKKESTNYMNNNDNFDYKTNFYINDINKKENNEIKDNMYYNKINNNNINNIYDYKEYLNEKDKTQEIINKNTYNSMNINFVANSKNEYNSNDFRNNLGNDSNLNQGFKSNQTKLNLNYDDNNVNIQLNKLKINNENNDTSYDLEKRYNIKTYFQLNQKGNSFNNNNNKEKNLYPSIEDGNKKLNHLSNIKNDEIETKSLRKYHSFSTPKNVHINHNMEENYTNITLGNNNKIDEMTQTNQIYGNKFYSLTQNRSYRNKDKDNIDIENSNTFDSVKEVNINIVPNTSNDNKTFLENNQEEYNKKIFNNSFNNRLQQHKCIHKCNSYRNNSNKHIGMFNKSSKNIIFNDNRNICKKCLKSKMNFANLNNMRICRNCQNLINNGNLVNYFTFN